MEIGFEQKRLGRKHIRGCRGGRPNVVRFERAADTHAARVKGKARDNRRRELSEFQAVKKKYSQYRNARLTVADGEVLPRGGHHRSVVRNINDGRVLRSEIKRMQRALADRQDVKRKGYGRFFARPSKGNRDSRRTVAAAGLVRHTMGQVRSAALVYKRSGDLPDSSMLYEEVATFAAQVSSVVGKKRWLAFLRQLQHREQVSGVVGPTRVQTKKEIANGLIKGGVEENPGPCVSEGKQLVVPSVVEKRGKKGKASQVMEGMLVAQRVGKLVVCVCPHCWRDIAKFHFASLPMICGATLTHDSTVGCVMLYVGSDGCVTFKDTNQHVNPCQRETAAVEVIAATPAACASVGGANNLRIQRVTVPVPEAPVLVCTPSRQLAPDMECVAAMRALAPEQHSPLIEAVNVMPGLDIRPAVVNLPWWLRGVCLVSEVISSAVSVASVVVTGVVSALAFSVPRVREINDPDVVYALDGKRLTPEIVKHVFGALQWGTTIHNETQALCEQDFRPVTDRNVTRTKQPMVVQHVTANVVDVGLASSIGGLAVAIPLARKLPWPRLGSVLQGLCLVGLLYQMRVAIVNSPAELWSVPHMVMCAAREYSRGAQPSVVKTSVTQKMLRLATLPLKDRTALELQRGSEFVTELIMSQETKGFLRGPGVGCLPPGCLA